MSLSEIGHVGPYITSDIWPYTHTQEIHIFVCVLIICVHVTLNEFCGNRKYFLYIVSSRFLFWIESESSSCADQFSMMASHVLSLKNEYYCLFLKRFPLFSPPFLVQYLYIFGPLSTPNQLGT